MARHKAVDAAKAKVDGALLPRRRREAGYDKLRVAGVFKELEAKIVRWNILDTGKRIDGRDVKTVRPIVSEVGILPRAHGSALFTRGETQALVVATLGTGEDEQCIDALHGHLQGDLPAALQLPALLGRRDRPHGRPGRREIGHGKLAWRAIHPMLPRPARVPLHDPRRLGDHRVERLVLDGDRVRHLARADGRRRAAASAPTAGIAMGLILEDKRFAVLSDILGDEDHLGDMDFKVAGTEKRRHLAADGHQDRRHHRGDHAGRARPGEGRPPAHPRRDGQGADPARAELGEHAPRIEMFKIPTDKIREVIGTGGKVIREIVEKTGAKIDIEDDGTVKVASANARVDQGGDQLDQVDRVASRRSARSTKARWSRSWTSAPS